MIDDELAALTRNLAAQLTRLDTGHTWKAAGRDHDDFERPHYLKSDDGLSIRCAHDTRHNRLKFSGQIGQLWQYKRRDEEHADITCNPARTVDDLARDIFRRLIPAYRSLRSVLLKRHQQRMDDAEHVHDLATGIVKAARGYAEILTNGLNQNQDEQTIYLNRSGLDGLYLTGRVSGYQGGSVYLQNAHLPAELFRRIVCVIADYADEQHSKPRPAAQPEPTIDEGANEDTTPQAKESPATRTAQDRTSGPGPNARPAVTRHPTNRGASAEPFRAGKQELSLSLQQSIFTGETL